MATTEKRKNGDEAPAQVKEIPTSKKKNSEKDALVEKKEKKQDETKKRKKGNGKVGRKSAKKNKGEGEGTNNLHGFNCALVRYMAFSNSALMKYSNVEKQAWNKMQKEKEAYENMDVANRNELDDYEPSAIVFFRNCSAIR